MRCRKAGLASARVNEVRGWPNLQKAWEARRLYLAEDRQRRLIEEQQLEFLRLREAKREMLRRWGIDPNAPKSTFTDDLSRLRRI